jgi:hypothetical protein
MSRVRRTGHGSRERRYLHLHFLCIFNYSTCLKYGLATCTTTPSKLPPKVHEFKVSTALKTCNGVFWVVPPS